MDIVGQIVRFETTLWNRVERGLLAQDLPGLGTLLALRIVHEHDGNARVLGLSAELAITVGAASKVVDRLAKAGLAVRRPHPEDGRSSLVSLTEAGMAARSAGDAAVAEMMDALFHGDDLVRVAHAALAGLQGRLDTESLAVRA